jgi:hypothetical protein
VVVGAIRRWLLFACCIVPAALRILKPFTCHPLLVVRRLVDVARGPSPCGCCSWPVALWMLHRISIGMQF